MNKPRAGSFVRHIRNGDIYQVIKFTLAKQLRGPWVESVNYAPVKPQPGQPTDFTRDLECFLKYFEESDNPHATVCYMDNSVKCDFPGLCNKNGCTYHQANHKGRR